MGSASCPHKARTFEYVRGVRIVGAWVHHRLRLIARFDRMEVGKGEVGILGRRKPNRGQNILELIAGPVASDVLFGIPDADDVKGRHLRPRSGAAIRRSGSRRLGSRSARAPGHKTASIVYVAVKAGSSRQLILPARTALRSDLRESG